MVAVVEFVRRPALAILFFGLLNSLNWFIGMSTHGCKGREGPGLLFFAIPFAAGIAFRDGRMLTAFVMIIPVVMTTDGSSYHWWEWLIENGFLCLAYLGLVLIGGETRKALGRIQRSRK